MHSGDATLVLPAQKLYVETIRQVKRISQGIARALSISGPFNIQFMSRENEVKVIECNLRASRTFPFISKTFDFNFIALAARVMAGLHRPLGNGRLGQLISPGPGGARPPVPASRVLFGSHAPYFPLETGLLRLFESPLDAETLHALMHRNARRLLPG